MVHFSDIKGFAFDLDGVITDTARFHEQAWHRTADQVGTKWDQALASSLRGISRMDSLEMILKAGHHENDYSEQEKEALADEKNHYYQQLIKKLTPNDILPGMKSFLDELKDNDYLMSVASASKNAPTILQGLGINDYFIGVVDPASLHAGKPDPEIFVKAGQLLGLQAGQIIGLEDAAAGIRSIKGAGQTALGIGPAAKTADPDLYFNETSEVNLANIRDDLTKIEG